MTQLVALVRLLRADAGAGADVDVEAVGVSLGGVVRERRVVESAVFLGWHDVPLADLLERELGLRVHVENDVVALVTAEHWFGPARDEDGFALVTVGAGLGYALVLHGEVVTGLDSGLAPLGHAPLDPVGPLCELGHRGCATAVLTTAGMCAQVAVVRGRPVAFNELLGDARAGDPVALAVVESAGRALGRLLAWVVNTTTVTTVVVSGEGDGLIDVAEHRVREALEADRPPGAAPVRLIVREPDFVMWARGAAAVAVQDSVPGLVPDPVGQGVPT